ncbi:MAG: Uma2 family endonuclease [Pseudomonadota bacterium]
MTETQKAGAEPSGTPAAEHAIASMTTNGAGTQPGTALIPAADTANGNLTPAKPQTPSAREVDQEAATAQAAPATEPETDAPEAAEEPVAAASEPEPAAPKVEEPSATLVVGPTPRQARAASVLGGVLGAPFDFGAGGTALGTGGWWLFQWPGLVLGGAAVQPALAGWSREKLPELPLDRWPEAAPDWVCEIVSGATVADAPIIAEKARVYAATGVQYLWVIDPVAGSLECLERGRTGWVQLGAFFDSETVVAPPFHTSAFPLSALWPD